MINPITITIDKFKISDKSSVFIIAELSANHNGRLDNAIATIKAAKDAGVDAIKLQTYTADTITLDVKSDLFKISQSTIWDGKYLYDLYQEAYTPWEWHEQLFQTAKEEGLICFSSPFDKTAVDLLENLNSPAYKIASFEITDIPLIEYVASKGKPVIISTGIAKYEEIEEAIAACNRQGNSNIALLKCTSEYPAPIEEANLLMIPDMAVRFKTIIGLSDHTLGDTVAIGAVALGARIIEKHFILDRKMGGPDGQFSMEPKEFKTMVQAIRNMEKAMGNVTYDITEKVKLSRNFSRSLFVVEDTLKGEKFTLDNIRSIRPGYGLPPKYLNEIVGKHAKCDIKKGSPLVWDYIIE